MTKMNWVILILSLILMIGYFVVNIDKPLPKREMIICSRTFRDNKYYIYYSSSCKWGSDMMEVTKEEYERYRMGDIILI